MNVLFPPTPVDEREPDAAYWRRRQVIADLAAGPGRPPRDIDYTPEEDATWATVAATLRERWSRHAAAALRRGLDRLALDPDRVPQLREVSAGLAPLSGFRFSAVPGLVAPGDFFARLAHGEFLSTQYVRWSGSPLYTPEPDVIHEVFGHGHVLTVPELADLHRLAGAAYTRLERSESRQFVADVFWFSAEFGVVHEDGAWRAYGAGLLSSVGELDWYATGARVEPLDIARMGTQPYDIDHYQPVLFGATSLRHVHDVVGGFFADCTDDTIAALRMHPRPAGRRREGRAT